MIACKNLISEEVNQSARQSRSDHQTKMGEQTSHEIEQPLAQIREFE